MIVSVTERGVFRRCRTQWDYSSFNRQHLTPLMPPTALSFGSLIHKSHEEWLLHPDDEIDDIVGRVGAKVIDGVVSAYAKRIGVPPEDRELSGIYDQIFLAKEVLTNYKTHWGASLPEGFTLIKPEQTILLPIPGTEHICDNPGHTDFSNPSLTFDCPECHGDFGPDKVSHYLEATLDALMADKGGRLWILERKTYNQKPKVEVLGQNDQFLAYSWVITQVAQGNPIGGLFYDGMWKRPLKDERGKERSFEDLFFRTPLIRSPEEVRNFEYFLRQEVLDMADPNLRIYPNRVWQGCWDCQFVPLCEAQYRGEDFSLILQTKYTSRERNDWQEDSDAE